MKITGKITTNTATTTLVYLHSQLLRLPSSSPGLLATPPSL